MSKNKKPKTTKKPARKRRDRRAAGLAAMEARAAQLGVTPQQVVDHFEAKERCRSAKPKILRRDYGIDWWKDERGWWVADLPRGERMAFCEFPSREQALGPAAPHIGALYNGAGFGKLDTAHGWQGRLTQHLNRKGRPAS